MPVEAGHYVQGVLTVSQPEFWFGSHSTASPFVVTGERERLFASSRDSRHPKHQAVTGPGGSRNSRVCRRLSLGRSPSNRTSCLRLACRFTERPRTCIRHLPRPRGPGHRDAPANGSRHLLATHRALAAVPGVLHTRPAPATTPPGRGAFSP